jgi:hypothetical protein
MRLFGKTSRQQVDGERRRWAGFSPSWHPNPPAVGCSGPLCFPDQALPIAILADFIHTTTQLINDNNRLPTLPRKQILMFSRASLAIVTGQVHRIPELV